MGDLSAPRLRGRGYGAVLTVIGLVVLGCLGASAQEQPARVRIDMAAYTSMVRQLERDEGNGSGLFQYIQPPDVRLPNAEELAMLRELLQREARGVRTGNFPLAIDARRQSVEIFDVTFGPNHPIAAASLIWLANYHRSTAQLREGEALWRRAIASSDALMARFAAESSGLRRARVVVADMFSGLALNLALQGRDAEALPAYVQALALREAALGVGNANTSGTINQLAMTLDRLGRHEEAEPLHRRSVEIREASHLPEHAANSRLHLGRNLFMQGRYDEAAVALREARTIVWPQDRIFSQINVALAEEALGNVEAAETVLREAANTFGSATDGAEAQLHLAALLSRLGRDAEAIVWSESALATYERQYGRESPFTGWALEVDARARLGQGDVRAHEAAQRAFQAYARMISRAGDGQLPGVGWQSPSSNAAALLLRTARGNATGSAFNEGFVAAQMLGDAGATNAMAAGAARVAADDVGLGEAVLAWRDAQARANAFTRLIAEAAAQGAEGDGRRAALLSELASANAEKDAREAALRRQFPRFFDLIASPPATVSETQALLGADEALLLVTDGEASLPEGQRRGVVFALTREGVAWADLELEPQELAAAIRALHAQLSEGGATRAPGTGDSGLEAGVRGFNRALSHRLYQALFGTRDIAALVASKTRWTLAPQGVLLSAPFAALVVDTPGAGADSDPAVLRATRFLGLERTIALTPSVAALRAQRGVVAAAPNSRFFGLGDPAFEGASTASMVMEMRGANGDRAGNAASVRSLQRLPHTRIEIERLAAAFGARRSDYVLGAAANEAELRRRAAQLGRADVIAFATHGLIAGDLHGSLLEPALALTPPAAVESESDDGLLTASEAARLRLNARWVILSACNTASGGQPGAEGLTGLARGFFYAGARTLLVSQWPVDDEAAQHLTTNAVELQREQNLSSAEAMRRSMQALFMTTSRDGAGRSFAHPSAWAPFVLVSGE